MMPDIHADEIFGRGRVRRPTEAHHTLKDVHQTFRTWFGDEYDLDAIDAVLAAAAAERLTGDPLWVLLVSGSGSAKTETVGALSKTAGVILTSTVASEGALLSGTSRKDRAHDATGGLLRRLGDRGVLVIKDFTSILSMHRDSRASVLAALREVYDGRWERNIGMDGGRSLCWIGRIALIGACTTAWDRAHDVVASMGDRFVILRLDSSSGRQTAGYQALKNKGQEDVMRAALAASVADVLARADLTRATPPSDTENTQLLAAADLVTLARTAVDYDYTGALIDSHAPEMPTRFLKQLLQVMHGACTLGMAREDALRLALRCARDSMPPLRLAILEDVAAHPRTRARDVRQRLEKPYTTIDRQLQALHMLGVLECDEVEPTGGGKSSWYYRLKDGMHPSVIPSVSRNVTPHTQEHREEEGASLPTS